MGNKSLALIIGVTVVAAAGGVAWLVMRKRSPGASGVFGMTSSFVTKPNITHKNVGWKSGKRTKPIAFVVIHHTATTSPAKTRAALKAKGLSTHYEVTKTGDVLEYLDPAKRVAWASKWANSQGIGIDVTHASGAAWPPEQVVAVTQLVAQLCADNGLVPVVAPDNYRYTGPSEVIAAGVTVLRHRNIRPTACPEDFPMQLLGIPYNSLV